MIKWKWLALFCISFFIFFSAAGFIFYLDKKESEDFLTSPQARIRFPLDNKNATYNIMKTDSGFYMLQYTIGQGYQFGKDPNIDDTRSEYIGSSKVNLEDYVGKNIRVTAQHRTTFGTPLCWKAGCLRFADYGANRETVVDIENIQTQ